MPKSLVECAVDARKVKKARANRRVVKKCSNCGWMVRCVNSAEGHARHAGSLYHRHAARLRALLGEPCITAHVIAERLGVTHQRVCQIAAQLGIDLGERQAVCTVRKADKRLQDAGIRVRGSESLRAKLVALRDAGAMVRAQRIVGSLGFVRASIMQVEINGHPCRIKVSRMKKGWKPDPLRGNACYFRFPFNDALRAGCRFVLFHLEVSNSTYVVPTESLPPGRMIYIPVGRIEGYNNVPQRDWEQFRENWSQLAANTDLSVEG